MITLKVEVCRKEGTDNYGSIGAACAVEGIEVQAGADMAEILRLRDHWLGLCEATVDDELARLRGTRAGGGNGHAAPTRYAEPEREAPRPERQAPARSARGRVEPEDIDDQEEDEKPPTDGRQLLGWAAKQRPDAKPEVISYGQQKRIKGKVIDWTPQQVRAAYNHVRGTR